MRRLTPGFRCRRCIIDLEERSRPQCPAHWELTKMMDQHAYPADLPEDDLRVGDMIAFDISHPCLTFDKWRDLPVLDSAYKVVDVVQTFF